MELLHRLALSSNADELRSVANELSLAEYLNAKQQKYPNLNLVFGNNMSELEEKFDFKLGQLRSSSLTQLEKLFYAVSWKQGDIRKLKHVYEGLKASSDEPPAKGLIFWYFGKHLADPINNPIVDRNVILTFTMYNDPVNLERILKVSTLSAKELPFVRDFIDWYRTKIKIGLRTNKECRQLLDDVLFAVGQRRRKQDKHCG